MNLVYLAVAACALRLGEIVAGQPTVIRVPTVATSATVTETFPGSNVWNVALATTVASEPTTFTVRGSSTAEVINSVAITANTPQSVNLHVRGPDVGTTLTSVANIDIDVGSSLATIILQELRTSGNVGAIAVHTIAASNIGGNITGNLMLKPRNGGGNSTLIAMMVTGNVLGDILVDYGEIHALTVDGDIGTATTPSTIRVRDNIQNIIADRVCANFTSTNADPNRFRFRRIETTVGILDGSLPYREIANNIGGSGIPGVYVAGSLGADIDCLQSLDHTISVGGDLQAAGSILIGNNLRDNGSVRGKILIGNSGGLKGQVIINRNNGSGTWTGEVKVGGTTLSHTNGAYTTLSSVLGGGAVGLAPFTLHREDCVPTHGEEHTSVPNNEIVLWFYGPVTASVSMPFTVEHAYYANGQPVEPFSDVTDDFYAVFDTNKRKVTIRPQTWLDFSAPSIYRVTPTSDLKCFDVNGTPPVDDKRPYDLILVF